MANSNPQLVRSLATGDCGRSPVRSEERRQAADWKSLGQQELRNFKTGHEGSIRFRFSPAGFGNPVFLAVFEQCFGSLVELFELFEQLVLAGVEFAE